MTIESPPQIGLLHEGFIDEDGITPPGRLAHELVYSHHILKGQEGQLGMMKEHSDRHRRRVWANSAALWIPPEKLEERVGEIRVEMEENGYPIHRALPSNAVEMTPDQPLEITDAPDWPMGRLQLGFKFNVKVAGNGRIAPYEAQKSFRFDVNVEGNGYTVPLVDRSFFEKGNKEERKEIAAPQPEVSAPALELSII